MRYSHKPEITLNQICIVRACINRLNNLLQILESNHRPSGGDSQEIDDVKSMIDSLNQRENANDKKQT